jgi:hypothetical protein
VLIASLTMPVFTIAEVGRRQHGSEASRRGQEEGAAHQQLPRLRQPPVWCVDHLFRDGAPEDGGDDPSREAPGFHAHLMVPECPKLPPRQPSPERPQQAISAGPMMNNFDSFLEHYDPTDEQIALGAQLLLGNADNPDTTMEQLLMSMLGSLELYAVAVEAGINY